MSSVIERDIQKALLKGLSCKDIAKGLIKKRRFLKNTDDFISICRFLFQAGLYQLIIDVTLNRLSKMAVIPWAFVMEILSLHIIMMPTDLKKIFVTGILEQDQVVSVLSTQSWDKDLPHLAQLKTDMINQLYREKNQRFVKLMEDLQFIQAQGFLKKEKEVLNELKNLEPDNPFIHEQWIKAKEKSARVFLQKKQSGGPEKQLLIPYRDTQEEQTLLEIVGSIKNTVMEQPEKSYDMALFFLFIGYPLQAIDFLKNHLNSFSAEWLYVDVLLQTGLYLDCLSFLDELEAQYGVDPEVPFSLAYIRARAYYGLGQKKRARGILIDLLKVRPRYRLVQFLLRQWDREGG